MNTPFRIVRHKLFILGIILTAWSSSLTAQDIHHIHLDNGLHVIVNPIAEAVDVGVESIYHVGFVHEPEGMVQSAHLLEHLVCYSPGAGFEAKGAMEWLNQVGVANAETLPTLTHYDYAAPAAELEKVLRIEAARLQQTQFDRQLMLAEAKRVYQETDMVASNPATGMLKHAFMSLTHAWKFQSKETLVRGGIESFDMNQLLSFYKSTYHPGNLTLVISGKTTAEEVEPLIQKHFAKIPASTQQATAVDWENVPAQSTVHWDSEHSAVCIAWKPPADPDQQRLLSVLGLMAMQRMYAAPELKKECTMVMTSNNMWNVGELPLFVYAMVKPGVDLETLQETLAERFQNEIQTLSERAAPMAKALAYNYDLQLKPSSWARTSQAVQSLVKMGKSETKSIQQVLLHDALTRGMMVHFLGNDPGAAITKLKSATAEDYSAALTKAFREGNRTVVHIVPIQK